MQHGQKIQTPQVVQPPQRREAKTAALSVCVVLFVQFVYSLFFKGFHYHNLNRYLDGESNQHGCRGYTSIEHSKLFSKVKSLEDGQGQAVLQTLLV